MLRLTTLTLLVFTLLSAISTAQTPIVTSAYFLEWDNPNPPGAVEETRIYLSSTPNIIPDGASFTGVVTGDVNRWAISALPGTYYAVVTFKSTGPDNEEIETPPSNEIVFTILGTPSNLRIVR